MVLLQATLPRLRHTISRSPVARFSVRFVHPRAYTTTGRLHQDVFHSQASDSVSSAILSSLKSSNPTPQTLTEKIIQRYSVGLPKDKLVKSGDYVTLSPHRCMSHDNSSIIISKFLSIGASKIHDPQQVVIALDHDVQNKSESNLKKYRQIEKFAKGQGTFYHPPGRGIGHQVMVEEGFSWPGTLAVASDSHSNMYGGISCLSFSVVRTDAASIWATGNTWFKIPPIAMIHLTGLLPKGVTGKDVIVALCGLFNNDEVLNHAIEFTGSEETMRSLPVDDRLTIANMTTEWGALSGLFPLDSTLESWLRYKATAAALETNMDGRAAHPRFTHPRLDSLFKNQLSADKGAKYAKHLYLNLSTLSPYVSGPNSVKVATPLNELESQGIKVNKAYLVSCTNSRASDLAAAAKVFKDAAKANGHKIPRIAEGVNLYIAAASLPEQQAAEEAGDWQALLDAGAEPLLPGCAQCIGLGKGLLEPGEIGISASNRNFKGRMGSRDAKAYLASPEVVAASALSGKISGPGWYERPEGVSGVIRGEGEGNPTESTRVEKMLEQLIAQADTIIHEAEQSGIGSSPLTTEKSVSPTTTDILPGFPAKISGEILFCDADNINTDGIYPGKYTYQDNLTPAQMAAVCMENYDPSFQSTAQKGDILVSGFNFGSGSSREQAATSLLARGVSLVVAGSLSNIFERNSINNALMVLEVPQLVARLRAVFAPNNDNDNDKDNDDDRDRARMLTRRTGWRLVWDVAKSEVVVTEGEGGAEWKQKVGVVGKGVQEIVARGGLEGWVRGEIEGGKKKSV